MIISTLKILSEQKLTLYADMLYHNEIYTISCSGIADDRPLIKILYLCKIRNRSSRYLQDFQLNPNRSGRHVGGDVNECAIAVFVEFTQMGHLQRQQQVFTDHGNTTAVFREERFAAVIDKPIFNNPIARWDYTRSEQSANPFFACER